MNFLKKAAIVKKIKRRKKILNILLRFMSPTNKLMIYLSQNLDRYVTLYQKHLSIKYKKKHSQEKLKKVRKSA